MKNKPNIAKFPDGSLIWKHRFNKFTAKVYVPGSSLPGDIINFGYEAPYLLYFEEKALTNDEAKHIADESGLSKIAASKAGSVVFISPNNAGGWEKAPEGLFEELIENSKIHQYHENGMAVLVNRFSHSTDGYAIRGAIFRTFLYGKGKAADYIAKFLLKTINGQGLWGPADVAPTGCILENLSVVPNFERRDMPVVSVGNSDKINAAIASSTDYFKVLDKLDFDVAISYYLYKYMRWGWVGTLMPSPDPTELNMTEEYAVVEVNTSSDNCGDDAGTKKHRIGYVAFYNNDLEHKGPMPLLLCFHGGGDSAMHISESSGWYKVAHDHDFLLVCIENHLNSTATEMMELIEHLKKRYPIDTTRIYASGFSMGGCKSWDLYQEYPKVFAGLAPMDATFEVGLNVFGKPAPCKINEGEPVPIFYVGGEETPLPELPFQAEKCRDRMEYVFKVNHLTTKYDVKFEDHEKWADKIWGISGDKISKVEDKDRDSILTINYFKSADGEFYTAFASVSGQGHECRYHSCEHAWRFLEKFRRNPDGTISIVSEE